MDAFRPARHLSNNTLRQAFRAFLIPTVAEKYHAIAVRCLWRVEKNEPYRAHALISGKRKQLELLPQRTPMVKIVISAITGQEEETKKRKKPNKKAKGDKKSRKHARREDSDEGNSSEESGNDGDDNEDNDDISDLFPGFDSAPSQITCGQKHVYPGISFWIVIDAPYSCMSDIDTNIRQLFIKSGMEIDKCKPINPPGKSGNLEVHTASLCQVIKDHKNQFAKDLAKDSAQDFAGISTEILCGQIMCNYHANRDDVFPNNPESGSKVVRVTVCNSCPRQMAIDFTKALQEYVMLDYLMTLLTRQHKWKTPYLTPKLLLLGAQPQTKYAVL